MNTVFIGNSHLDQFLLHSIEMSKSIVTSPGASIKGLMNTSSTTNLNTRILPHITSGNILVFHLGQVDFEFGYYYKSALSNHKLDKAAFIETILSVYETYITSVVRDTPIIVVGLNPTAIDDMYHTYTVNFKDTMCSHINLQQETGQSDVDNRYVYDRLGHIYNDTIVERNNFLYMANMRMKDMCRRLNIAFCDLWDILIDSTTTRLKPAFHPGRLDHHIKPSVELRNKLISVIRTIQAEM
jgi:hypothetical protein